MLDFPELFVPKNNVIGDILILPVSLHPLKFLICKFFSILLILLYKALIDRSDDGEIVDVGEVGGHRQYFLCLCFKGGIIPKLLPDAMKNRFYLVVKAVFKPELCFHDSKKSSSLLHLVRLIW